MSPILRTPVREASAWKRADVERDHAWDYRLSDAEAEELRAATASAASNGLESCRFDKIQFPLPAFGPRLSAALHELEYGRGFVMFRGLPVVGLAEPELETLYFGIGAHLGRVITQNSRGDRIGRVTDRGNEYTTTGVRGHGSRHAIQPHCDSSDLVGLLCVQPAARGGRSLIASASSIYNEILHRHPQYLEVLCRGFRINLAGKGPTGRADELTRGRIPVFSYYRGRLSCRFNQKQIEDAAKIMGEPLSALEQSAVRTVGELACREDLCFPMGFGPGDLQLLNNHCVLHARDAYEDDPPTGRRRLLLRLWINVDGGRPLAPDFADRLNTGPRGEVAVISQNKLSKS